MILQARHGTHIDSGTAIDPPAKTIAVARLSKFYETGRESILALDGVDFGISGGQFVALVGPSGCGKSTLLKILAGLMRASRGQARLCGTPIEWPRRDIGNRFDPAAIAAQARAYKVK